MCGHFYIPVTTSREDALLSRKHVDKCQTPSKKWTDGRTDWDSPSLRWSLTLTRSVDFGHQLRAAVLEKVPPAGFWRLV